MSALVCLIAATAAILMALALRRRRRRRLNRALHELRRPLQALVLGCCREGGSQELIVERVRAAAADLDRAINGGWSLAPECWETSPVGELIGHSIAAVPGLSGRRVEVSGEIGGGIVGDRDRLGAAIENLLANAADHGDGEIRVGVDSGGLVVSNRLPPDGEKTKRKDRRDPRRGHGLDLSRELIQGHGGRIVAGREGGWFRSRIELPVLPGTGGG